MHAGERLIPAPPEVPAPAWVTRMDQLTEQGIPYLFILDFDLREPVILPLTRLDDTKIRFQLSSFAPKSPVGDLHPPPDKLTTHDSLFTSHFWMGSGAEPSLFTKSPVPYSLYLRGFTLVSDAIQAGDTYLLNLCYPTRLSGISSLEDVYAAARAPYKLLVPGRFVLFSPEQFVSISDGIIRTFPMKGTIDASVPEAERVLLADVKEQEEHATVVDLLRNDLSIVARKVTVNRYRYLTEIKTQSTTLLQCSSEISGELRETYRHHYGSLMHAILPAGSVTGAPKKRTVEIIREAELEPRGFFTGVFGVFDGKNLDSAVMIRMIEQRDDGYYYRSGGGITYRSRAADEYQEMIDKVYVPVS